MIIGESRNAGLFFLFAMVALKKSWRYRVDSSKQRN